MKWCCSQCEHALNNTGKRGFSIVVGTGSIKPLVFFLQHRSLDIRESGPSEPFPPYLLASQVAINHCPWCGHNLQRWYGKSAKELIKEEFILGRSSDSQ
jgi:hypothetical protein